MTRTIILHQMTAMAIAPTDLPALAASIGCREVSLFTYTPDAGLPKENSGFTFPLVTPAMKTELLNALDSNNICVSGIEFFPIAADINIESFASSLALGKELGARRAVTLVFDDDTNRAIDKLGQLSELAMAEELALCLEFTPLTPGCQSLSQAVNYVDQLGTDRLGLGIDALHLVRSGASAEDLLALSADYFRYSQICDGHGTHSSADYYGETHNRELVGNGDFPLADILNALPATIDLEVEIPSEARWSDGVSPQQHAKEAVNSAKALVDRLQPSR